MGEPLRILILEDLDADAQLEERALRAAGIDLTARRVDGRAEFEQALRDWRPHAVLADYRLPDFDCHAALRLARERLPEAPVIVVTGTLTDDTAVALLREGAYDYVLKDRLSRLGPAVLRAIEAARADAARREAQERYRLLFDQARDGVALIAADSGKVVEANPEFCRQAGRAIDELRQLPGWQLSVPMAVEAERLRFMAAAGNAGGSDWAFDMQRPDGTQLPVEVRAKRVELRGQIYVLVTSRDVSERRAAERRLLEQLDELQRFQRVTVDRELRLNELEEEVRRLKGKGTA